LDLLAEDLDCLDRLIVGQLLSTREAGASIDRLQQHGCTFEHRPHGVELVRTSPSVWRDYLEDQFKKHEVSRRITIYQQTASTQDACKNFGEVPCVVAADEQTRGRGRLGRTWTAPPGSAVLFSLNTPLRRGGFTTDTLSLMTAVAVTQALDRLTQTQKIGIKWPNDLMLGGRKLAGILIEARGRSAVIGVGINARLTREQKKTMPPDVRPRVATVADILPGIDRLAVLSHCVLSLHAMLEAGDAELQRCIDLWRSRSTLSNQRQAFLTSGHPVSGTVIDIDAHDGLLLRRDSGELIHLHAATTSVVTAP